MRDYHPFDLLLTPILAQTYVENKSGKVRLVILPIGGVDKYFLYVFDLNDLDNPENVPIITINTRLATASYWAGRPGCQNQYFAQKLASEIYYLERESNHDSI